MSRYHELRDLKNKYAKEILSIEGVYGIGIRVLENKIVVYCNEVTPLTLLSIPTELEAVVVDVIGNEHIAPAPAIWNEEVPFPPSMMNVQDVGLKKYRPFPIGVSLGHINISAGTGGIPLWSRKLNKPVIVSNNHVLSMSAARGYEPRARCRQYTDSITLDIQPGGTPYTGTGLVEIVTPTTPFILDFNTPVINQVSPLTAQVGDVITIIGKSLGFRKGYSKVWFGNVEATVKSWHSTSNNLVPSTNYLTTGIAINKSLDTDSVIEVYVPDGITGQIDLRIEIEGDPITQPGPYDGGTLADQVGQLEDYVPLTNKQRNDNGIGFKPTIAENCAGGDVAIFSLIDNSLFANKVVTHTARYNYDVVNDYGTEAQFLGYSHNGIDYFINGMQQEFCEGLPVMKVGRSTGTTFSVIYDPSFSCDIMNYPGYSEPAVFPDVVLWASSWSTTYLFNDETGVSFKTNNVFPGDSGSSYFIARREDYLDYMTSFELFHKTDSGTHYTMTNADFDAVEQIVPIEPMNWIGNCFAAYVHRDNPLEDPPYNGIGDKAVNWLGAFDVYPLGKENENPYMQLATITSANETQAELVIDMSIYLNLAVNVTAEIDCWVEGDRITVIDLTLAATNATSEATVITQVISTGVSTQISIGNINLTPAITQPNNSIAVDLTYVGDNTITHYVGGKVDGNSSATCSVAITLTLLNLQGAASSIANTSIIVNLLAVGWTYDPWFETVRFNVSITRETKNDVAVTCKLEKEVQL